MTTEQKQKDNVHPGGGGAGRPAIQLRFTSQVTSYASALMHLNSALPDRQSLSLGWNDQIVVRAKEPGGTVWHRGPVQVLPVLFDASQCIEEPQTAVTEGCWHLRMKAALLAAAAVLDDKASFEEVSSGADVRPCPSGATLSSLGTALHWALGSLGPLHLIIDHFSFSVQVQFKLRRLESESESELKFKVRVWFQNFRIRNFRIDSMAQNLNLQNQLHIQ